MLSNIQGSSLQKNFPQKVKTKKKKSSSNLTK